MAADPVFLAVGAVADDWQVFHAALRDICPLPGLDHRRGNAAPCPVLATVNRLLRERVVVSMLCQLDANR